MRDFRSVRFLRRAKAATRGIALLVALVFLFLSSFVTLGESQHAMIHGERDHHGEQHSSFFCAWKCTATNFVETSPQGSNILFGPQKKYLHIFYDLFVPGDSLSFIKPRGPPF